MSQSKSIFVTKVTRAVLIGPLVMLASLTFATGEAGATVFHGIALEKGCSPTTLVGQSVSCSFIIGNDDTGGDTYTIQTLTDVENTASGPLSSGNVLPDLVSAVVTTAGATCSSVSGECTMPPGSTVEFDNFAFYTVQPADYNLAGHMLTDQVTVTWNNTCNVAPSGCNANVQSNQSSDGTVVTLYAPSVATTLSPLTSATYGQSITDTATLTSESSDAGGTVDFSVYADSACTTLIDDLGAAPVVAGSAVSAAWVASTLGTVYFEATYSGDGSNQSAQSPCASEPITISSSPSIAISKTPASQEIDAGGTATWTILVTNSGDVPLSDVTVTDPLSPNCATSFTGTLAVGASEASYTCTLENVTSGFTNVATVTGTPPIGANVTAQDSAVVVVDLPSIGISKTPHSQEIASGGTATWTILVTNTGDVPLSDVTVTDPLSPNCATSFTGTLAVGASEASYTCTLDDVTSGFTNVATATGTPPIGANVTAQDSAVVTLTPVITHNPCKGTQHPPTKGSHHNPCKGKPHQPTKGSPHNPCKGTQHPPTKVTTHNPCKGSSHQPTKGSTHKNCGKNVVSKHIATRVECRDHEG